MINYWKLAQAKLLLLGALPIVAGGAIGWYGWERKQAVAAFVENLRDVEGRVLRMESRDGGAVAEFEYLNEDGVPFVKTFAVDTRQERELQAIGKANIVYDVRDPRVAELGHVVNSNTELLVYWAITAAGGLLVFFGLGVIAVHARRSAATLALFRNGQLVATEVRDSALAPGGKAGRFTYAFRGPNGRWYEGKSPELAAARLAAWPVGTPLLVAYDPVHPDQSDVDIFGVVAPERRATVLPS